MHSKYRNEHNEELVVLIKVVKLFNKEKYSEKVDLWSTGCVLYLIIAGRAAFDEDDIETVKEKVLEQEPEFAYYPW